MLNKNLEKFCLGSWEKWYFIGIWWLARKILVMNWENGDDLLGNILWWIARTILAWNVGIWWRFMVYNQQSLNMASWQISYNWRGEENHRSRWWIFQQTMFKCQMPPRKKGNWIGPKCRFDQEHREWTAPKNWGLGNLVDRIDMCLSLTLMFLIVSLTSCERFSSDSLKW